MLPKIIHKNRFSNNDIEKTFKKQLSFKRIHYKLVDNPSIYSVLYRRNFKMCDYNSLMLDKIQSLWSGGRINQLPYILQASNDNNAAQYGITVNSIATITGKHTSTVSRRLKELQKQGKMICHISHGSPAKWWPKGGLTELKFRVAA